MAKSFIWVIVVLLSHCCISCNISGVGVNEVISEPEPIVTVNEPVIIDTVVVSDDLLPGDPPLAYIEDTGPIIVQQPTAAEQRELLQIVYHSQIGVREKTGKNDGPAVEMYLRSVGLGKGYAYCSAFVHWALDSAGIENNVTAWSPSAHNSRNVVYENRRFKKDPTAGDVFTIWYTSKKRIAHTGFIDSWVNSSIVTTVEANTNDALSREGDGVYMKKRPIHTLYTITRFIKD